MRRSYRGKKRKPEEIKKQFKANEKISSPEIILIDETGENHGVVRTTVALAMAQEKELDLIEVSPKAQPPICKIMDYGSFKYKQEKLQKKNKAKQKTGELKTIKLSPRIGNHDMEFRSKQGAKFLIDRNKLKIELQLRGREHQHKEQAEEIIKNSIEKIKAILTEKDSKLELKIEQPIKKQGSKITTIIST